MKIQLAWNVAGLGGPDDVVEVDDATGARLLADGLARHPDLTTVDPADLEAAELDTAAAIEGVDLGDAHTAKQKRAAISAAREQRS